MYSLRKSTHILKESYKRFKKREKKLYPQEKEEILGDFKALNVAIIEKNKTQAHGLAKSVQEKMHRFCPKNFFDHAAELVFALIFALVVATLVRTMWFELYEIPTGSMRPTFKEQDNLIASKTTFGINVPLLPKHFMFDKDLVKRNDVVIFTVEDMDVSNPDTVYFYLFPGKRLLIKRLIGKPGDSLYFYGGKIYGVDKEGNQFESPNFLDKIDHVPFISFEGKVKRGEKAQEVLFYQSNIPLAKLSISSLGSVKGSIYNGTKWVPDDPKALFTPHDTIESYSDFWGFNNYAMALLLTKEDVKKYTEYTSKDLPEALAYLELSHTPNLTYPSPKLIKDEYGRVRPTIVPQKTIIALNQEHIDKLMDALYTARFVVKNGIASRYSNEPVYPSSYDPKLPGVPDGTYEFYYGKAYKILWGGLTTELPKDHPLYNRDLKNVQTLFNLGIDLNTLYSPHKDSLIYPQRFAYFRDNNLYVMGAPIFSKEDPILTEFVKEEQSKESASTAKKPYVAFIDRGVPDIEKIKTSGLKIPESMYYVLGDNYAMSADGRDFGMVPESNLRGSPAFIVWPFGDRMGDIPQPSSSWVQLPNLIIWALFILIMIIWKIIQNRRLKEIQHELSSPK